MEKVWRNGMIGVIVGDALGLPVQFLGREEIRKNPVTGMRGYGTFNMPPGTWSDDGSLTLATMDSIRRKEGIDCEDMLWIVWKQQSGACFKRTLLKLLRFAPSISGMTRTLSEQFAVALPASIMDVKGFQKSGYR